MKLIETIKKNQNTILTVVSVAGVVGTAISSSWSMKTSYEKLKEKEEPTLNEKAVIYGTSYLPTIAITACTIATIICNHNLNKKQITQLTAAYVVLQQSYSKLQKGVKKVYEEEKELMEYRASLEDKTEEEELFFDPISNQYFNAKRSDVLEAILELNQNFATNAFVAINCLYDKLGIDFGPQGECLGWDVDEMACGCDAYFIEHYFDEVVIDDGLECNVLRFVWDPFVSCDIFGFSLPKMLYAIEWAKQHGYEVYGEDKV